MNTVLAWLAQDPAPPSQGPEFGGSSPIGLVVTLVLLIVLVFLIRSMNGHLRKLPTSFDETDQSSPDQPAGPAAGAPSPADEPDPSPDAVAEHHEPGHAEHSNGGTPRS